MIFFDYLYYRFCKFYYNHGDSGARISSLAVISVLQLFNIFTISFALSLLLPKFIISKLYAVILYAVLLILNGLRYNKLDYELLDKKWAGEEEPRRKKKNVSLIIYIVASTMVCVGMAIFLGSSNKA